MRTDDHMIEPRCPRCGYDQRGVVATWTESCPLQGLCSECGLEFDWATAIIPTKFEPAWCIEFTARRRSILGASVQTFVRSLWPWAFWSRMRMSYPVRVRRLLVYGALLALPFVLLYLAGMTALALYGRAQFQQKVNDTNAKRVAQVPLLKDQIAAATYAQKMIGLPHDEQLALLDNVPAASAISSSQMRSLVWQILKFDENEVQQFVRASEGDLLMAQQAGAAPSTIEFSALQAVCEMILMPWREYSLGHVEHADGRQSIYPAPATIIRETFSILRWRFNFWDDRLARRNGALISAAALTILLPMTFILLPVSRRRAKVRWVHIWRIFVYSLCAFVTLAWLLIAVSVADMALDYRVLRILGEQMVVVFWVALPIWWAVAIRRYLRMPHALAIALLMTVVVALLASPLLLNVFPKWFVRLVTI